MSDAVSSPRKRESSHSWSKHRILCSDSNTDRFLAFAVLESNSFIVFWIGTQVALRLKNAKAIVDLGESLNFIECKLCLKKTATDECTFTAVGLSVGRLQRWEIEYGLSNENLCRIIDHTEISVSSLSKSLCVSDPFLEGRLYIAIIEDASIVVRSESMRVVCDVIAECEREQVYRDKLVKLTFAGDDIVIALQESGIISAWRVIDGSLLCHCESVQSQKVVEIVGRDGTGTGSELSGVRVSVISAYGMFVAVGSIDGFFWLLQFNQGRESGQNEKKSSSESPLCNGGLGSVEGAIVYCRERGFMDLNRELRFRLKNSTGAAANSARFPSKTKNCSASPHSKISSGASIGSSSKTPVTRRTDDSDRISRDRDGTEKATMRLGEMVSGYSQARVQLKQEAH